MLFVYPFSIQYFFQRIYISISTHLKNLWNIKILSSFPRTLPNTSSIHPTQSITACEYKYKLILTMYRTEIDKVEPKLWWFTCVSLILGHLVLMSLNASKKIIHASVAHANPKLFLSHTIPTLFLSHTIPTLSIPKLFMSHSTQLCKITNNLCINITSFREANTHLTCEVVGLNPVIVSTNLGRLL